MSPWSARWVGTWSKWRRGSASARGAGCRLRLALDAATAIVRLPKLGWPVGGCPRLHAAEAVVEPHPRGPLQDHWVEVRRHHVAVRAVGASPHGVADRDDHALEQVDAEGRVQAAAELDVPRGEVGVAPSR